MAFELGQKHDRLLTRSGCTLRAWFHCALGRANLKILALVEELNAVVRQLSGQILVSFLLGTNCAVPAALQPEPK